MILLALPDYLLTVSGFTDGYQENLETRRELWHALEEEAGDVHLLSAFEPNPDGTGFHLHGWGRGDPVEGWQLTKAAETVGLGYTDLRPKTYDGAFDYIVKNATWNQASLAEHLRLNGNELMQGRGFWRDASTGEHLTQQQARTRVLDIRQDQPPLTPAQKQARWLGKNFQTLPAQSAGAVRDEEAMHLIDVESGEIVHTLGRRADLRDLDGQGDVGAIILTFRASDGRMRLLDGIAGGVRVVEYRSAA